MPSRRFNQAFVAGAFIQRSNTTPSSFTSLRVSSSFLGNSNMRGIATVLSGTAVTCVTAVGVVSGDVIILTPYMGTNLTSSGQDLPTGVQSVRAGAFNIVIVGSYAGFSANQPISWMVFK